MSHGPGATRGNQRGAKSLQAERADTDVESHGTHMNESRHTYE